MEFKFIVNKHWFLESIKYLRDADEILKNLVIFMILLKNLFRRAEEKQIDEKGNFLYRV